MTPHDPTSGPGWTDALPIDDALVDDPLTRVAGARGVESWQITPGAPPVRRARPAGGRTLLRDATIHRSILKKARATPVPAARSRRREAETEKKPEAHEREFFKPAAPLLTNVVVDRPPPVRKAVDPTWDPAPERVVTAPLAAPGAALEPDAELDHAWFLSAEGTLEPAIERVVLPPRRIAAFLAMGVVMAALALAAVAIGRGSAGSSAEASVAAVASAGKPSFDVVLPPEYQAPPVDVPAPEEVYDLSAGTAEPVEEVAVTAAVPAREADVAPAPPAVAKALAAPRAPAGTSSIDRLRASMADNALLATEPAKEPAAEPVEIPEGSAELWGGPIEGQAAPAANPWGDLE